MKLKYQHLKLLGKGIILTKHRGLEIGKREKYVSRHHLVEIDFHEVIAGI